jgi:hypothetical protein
MPALAAIADWGVPPAVSPDERRRRLAEPSQQYSESSASK